MKVLKFGGDNLVAPQFTHITLKPGTMRPGADGKPVDAGGRQVFVHPGDEVPFEEVDRAQEYVERGQATVSSGKAAKE